MKGRYAGVSMRAHRAMLPGAARLARLPTEPSEEAKRRMTIIKWYREPALQRKSPKPHLKRLRRPHGLSVQKPGALIQMDSKQVRMTNGKTVFQFGAVDCFTRKRVVALAPRLTSHQGARFLHKVIAGFSFSIQAIQSDGGSEFLGEFAQTVSELKLTHYFNRPNYPQGNGRIERSFRTDDDEFY